MKILSIAIISAILLNLYSCKGKHDYQLKLIYLTTKSNGVPILVNRGRDITAESDSAAYAKALEIDSLIVIQNKIESNGIYDHFELLNSEEVRVTREALKKNDKNE